MKVYSLVTLFALIALCKVQAQPIDSTRVVAPLDSANVKINYQAPLFANRMGKRFYFMSSPAAGIEVETGQKILEKLVLTGDLEVFDVCYLPWHPLQVFLLKRYLLHPDTTHLQYAQIAWQDKDEFPTDLFNAFKSRVAANPDAFANVEFKSMANFLSNSSRLKYKDKMYEYAMAIALNDLFPLDSGVGRFTDNHGAVFIPAILRTQVEALKALVSVAMWERVWSNSDENSNDNYGSKNLVRSEGRKDATDVEVVNFELDPSFGFVSTISTLRDSIAILKSAFEQWIPIENLLAFREIEPLFRVLRTDSVIDDLLKAEKSLIELIEEQQACAINIAKEKGKVLVCVSALRDIVDRSALNHLATPSLIQLVLESGVSKTEVNRSIFYTDQLFTDLGELDNLVSCNDADSINIDSIGVEQVSLPHQDSTNSADSVAILYSVSSAPCRLIDGLDVETQFYFFKDSEIDAILYDTAINVEENYQSSDITSNGWLGIESIGFDLAPAYLQTKFNNSHINTLLTANGCKSLPKFMVSQGFSLTFHHNAKKFINSKRLQVTQSSAIDNQNFQSFYAIWYDNTTIPMGKHFSLGLGGFTGYIQHSFQKYSSSPGGFINKDQASIRVTNPAYIYGFSIEPALRFGPLFLRTSAGYGWDFGNKSWKYNKQFMNSDGGYKSKGLYLTAEVGLAFKFSSDDLYSKSSSDETIDQTEVGERSSQKFKMPQSIQNKKGTKK